MALKEEAPIPACPQGVIECLDGTPGTFVFRPLATVPAIHVEVHIGVEDEK